MKYLLDIPPEKLDSLPQWLRDGIGTPNTTVAMPADVAAIAAHQISDRNKEHCLAVHLNGRNEAIGIHLVSMGSMNASIVHPREVYREAIKGGAAAIILVHNHPSGDPGPSDEDYEVTARIARAGDIVGIPCLDHVVIAWTTGGALRWERIETQSSSSAVDGLSRT